MENDGVTVIPTEQADPLPSGACAVLLTQLLQSGLVSQNNFISTTKAQDWDFLAGKRSVDAPEALAAREIAGK